MSLKCVRIVFVIALLGTFAGCENYALRSQLTAISDSLGTRQFRDTALWRSLSLLRPQVISARDAECDSLYNSLVRRIVESEYRSRHDLFTYLNSLKGASSILTHSDLGMAHDLRYWGSYNAARSQYGRVAVATAMSNIDAVANLGMEYERIGLIRQALRYVNSADSLYELAGNTRGRLWMKRLLYNIYSKLSDRQAAIRSLRSYRQLHQEFQRYNSWQMVDTITDVNLMRSLFQQSTWRQDLAEAYGNRSQSFLTMYHTVITGAPATWGNNWLTREPLLGPLPKPVIRRIPADRNTLAAMDSIVPNRSGELAFSTRFGTFVLRGTEFLLSDAKHPESHSNFVVVQSVPKLDTVVSSKTPFECVVPFGGDSLVAFTRDSIIILSSGCRSRYPRSAELKNSGSVIDCHPVGSSNVLVLLNDRIALASRRSFELKHSIELDVARKVGAFIKDYNRGIMSLSPTLFTVMDSRSSGVAAVYVDTLGSRIWAYKVLTRTKQNVTDSKLVQHFGSIRHFNWFNCGNDSIMFTVGPIVSVCITSSRGDDLSLTPIRSSPPYVSMKQYDNVDVIDTSTGLVYPQFALPLPIDPTTSQYTGVFKNQSGELTGFYCDGYSVVTFKLSQHSYRFHPSFYVVDPALDATDSNHVRRLESGQSLNARRGYTIAISSNMITSAFPIMTGFDDSTLANAVYQEGRTFWTTPVVPTPEHSALYVSTPNVQKPLRITISDPIMLRPWVAPFLISLTGVMGTIIAVGFTRSRRRRQALAIEHAKAEQLELLREDMHDMIGSRLVRIASLARQTSADQREEALSRIHDMTLVTVRSLRNLLTLMSETSMTDAGFYGSLREYVSESTNDAGLHCTVEIEIDSFERTSMDGTSRHELLMIVSELLTNTLRHSLARCVHFTVDARGSQTTITWSDDGVGLDPAAKRGNGLNNIQRRATRIGATVSVDSNPDNGTRFSITYPTLRD